MFEFFLFAFSRARWKNQKSGPLRIAAQNAFREFSIHSDDPFLRFDGSTARIVHETEEVNDITSQSIMYNLTIYAYNEVGEYFMYVSNQNASPFFKHLSHTNAKVVLGKAYVESAEIKNQNLR